MKGLKRIRLRLFSLAVCLSLLLGGCAAAEDVSPAPAAETPAAQEIVRHTPAPAPKKTPVSTPSPEPEPEPAPEEQTPPPAGEQAAETPRTMEELRVRLEEMVAGFDGEWSVYCKRKGEDDAIVINDVPMTAASLIKLYVYGAACQAMENGTLDADVYGSLLHPMITVSDNYSCNQLIDAVGGFDAVNNFISDCGFTDSVLNRKMLADGPENYTSAGECGRLLEMVLDSTFVSPETSAALLEDLRAQTRTTKIPAGVPDGVVTANKTGELLGVENDAAIVFADTGIYILCVMSEGASNAAGNITRISAAVYAYLNG